MYNDHDFTGIDGRCMNCDSRPSYRAAMDLCPLPNGQLRAYWETTRDDYGRTVHYLHAVIGQPIGVVVAIPKRTREALGYSHFTNHYATPWQRRQGGTDKITQHQSLAAAKAALVEQSRAVVAA